jgi:hypothetical protein
MQPEHERRKRQRHRQDAQQGYEPRLNRLASVLQAGVFVVPNFLAYSCGTERSLGDRSAELIRWYIDSFENDLHRLLDA